MSLERLRQARDAEDGNGPLRGLVGDGLELAIVSKDRRRRCCAQRGTPGMPSALSPTNVSQSGMRASSSRRGGPDARAVGWRRDGRGFAAEGKARGTGAATTGWCSASPIRSSYFLPTSVATWVVA